MDGCYWGCFPYLLSLLGFFHSRAMHLRGGDEHVVVGRHICMGRTSRAAFSKIADVLHGSYVTLIMN